MRAGMIRFCYYDLSGDAVQFPADPRPVLIFAYSQNKRYFFMRKNTDDTFGQGPGRGSIVRAIKDDKRIFMDDLQPPRPEYFTKSGVNSLRGDRTSRFKQTVHNPQN